ncbi:MAG: hypothetical protein QOK44_3200 [Betaproteobacteria bacterium]|nr:hypothetical protein [Betaproteobacteria bacterium]
MPSDGVVGVHAVPRNDNLASALFLESVAPRHSRSMDALNRVTL